MLDACAVRYNSDMKLNAYKLSIAAFFLFAFCFSVPLIAQTPLPTSTPTPVSQPQNQTEPEKIAVLQAQLDLMRQYDQRLLNTVYWSLGSIGGIVLLVVGLGWYTNFRIYRRDVEDIKRDVKNDFENSLNSIKTSLRSEMLNESRNAVESSVKSAFRDIRGVQYQIMKLEAERWENTGVHANAVFTYSEMIQLANETYADMYVPEILEQMLRLLKTKEVLLTSRATASITKALVAVPTEYSADVDAINQLIRSLRSRPDRT